MQQKHFVVVIDQLISIEEKKILREIKIVNDDYLDHQDEIEDAEAQTQGHPQIVINTAAAAEPKTGDIFSLITEYKFVLSLVIFFILFLINKNALLSVLKALVEFTGIFKG
jgi:nitrate reductase beta subunit